MNSNCMMCFRAEHAAVMSDFGAAIAALISEFGFSTEYGGATADLSTQGAGPIILFGCNVPSEQRDVVMEAAQESRVPFAFHTQYIAPEETAAAYVDAYDPKGERLIEVEAHHEKFEARIPYPALKKYSKRQLVSKYAMPSGLDLE